MITMIAHSAIRTGDWISRHADSTTPRFSLHRGVLSNTCGDLCRFFLTVRGASSLYFLVRSNPITKPHLPLKGGPTKQHMLPRARSRPTPGDIKVYHLGRPNRLPVTYRAGQASASTPPPLLCLGRTLFSHLPLGVIPQIRHSVARQVIGSPAKQLKLMDPRARITAKASMFFKNALQGTRAHCRLDCPERSHCTFSAALSSNAWRSNRHRLVACWACTALQVVFPQHGCAQASKQSIVDQVVLQVPLTGSGFLELYLRA